MSDLTEIRDAARTFISEREWQQFQDPKSILLALVGEVGELAELLQWLPADVARERLLEEPLHTRAAEEMADVLIYLIGLADQCGVDLGCAALAKVAASADKYPMDQNRGIALTGCDARAHRCRALLRSSASVSRLRHRRQRSAQGHHTPRARFEPG